MLSGSESQESSAAAQDNERKRAEVAIWQSAICNCTLLSKEKDTCIQFTAIFPHLEG